MLALYLQPLRARAIQRELPLLDHAQIDLADLVLDLPRIQRALVVLAHEEIARHAAAACGQADPSFLEAVKRWGDTPIAPSPARHWRWLALLPHELGYDPLVHGRARVSHAGGELFADLEAMAKNTIRRRPSARIRPGNDPRANIRSMN